MGKKKSTQDNSPVKKKRTSGRPKTNWKEVEPKIIELMADGMSQARACKYVGIGEQTLLDYKKTNSGFSGRLEKAMQETHKLAHKSVKVGMLKDWKAGAWWLERTEPERFKEKKEVEVKDQPILIDDIMGEV